MTVAVPTDQAARDEIAQALGDTQFVEAGAGSGKTSALVGRIVRLVVEGQVTIEHVAAITFTEAAAAELKDRITERLERTAAGDEDLLPQDWDEARNAGGRHLAAVARQDIDAAAITTLHGFARRLLAEHPLEAGMPPVIEVLDDVQSSVSFNERWRTFLDELLADPLYEAVLLRAFVVGITPERLRLLAVQLNDHWDLLGPSAPVGPLIEVDVRPVLEPLWMALDLAGHCTDPADKLLVRLETMAHRARQLEEADGDLEVLELINALAGGALAPGKVGRREAWSGQKPTVTNHLEAAHGAVVALRQRVIHEALLVLTGALAGLVRAGVDERRRNGHLEFHDLLVHARDLLRNSVTVRAALHERYRRIFIDEFQDTDPIQIELAARLAAEGGPETAGPWMDLELVPGHLFFVGDPMQSIYGFRRADVARFSEARSHFVDDALRLTTNFRSVEGIVDWVNHLFGAMIGDGEPGIQSGHEPLTSVRANLTDEPPVLVVGGPGDKGVSAAEVREHEADDVAAIIEKIRDERWRVGDERRPVELRDIAILIPSRTTLGSLQGALDGHNVAYQLETSSLVYSAREVEELLAVLRAIADPTDEVSVLGALRSSLYGCGDDDLLSFTTAGGRWDYRRATPEGLAPDHPVQLARDSLDALHRRHFWLDVSALIDEVLAERWGYGLALDQARPREVSRRLRFIVDQARRFSNSFGGDLRRYLQWTEVQATDEVRVTEVVLPEADHDAVRVMTIHAAKGLEFPIVILAGLGTASPPERGARILGEAGSLEVRLHKGAALETLGFEALQQAETLKDRAERQRLLYVAATRARDYLVVSRYRAERAGSGSLAALLEPHLDDFAQLWRVPVLDERRLPSDLDDEVAHGADVATSDVDASFRQRRAAWLADHDAALAAEARPQSISATRAVKLVLERQAVEADESEGNDANEADGDEESGHRWRRGRAGTAFGRAVHATLQAVDLATGAGLDELARANAIVEGIGERDRDVARIVRATLGSATVRQALTRRHWREFYVGVPVNSRVLEGFIDLLVEHDDGFEVVDYKTDHLVDEVAMEERMATYRYQGAAYALGVELATGRPVTRCTFLFVGTGVPVARTVVDLDEAVNAVRGIFTAV